MSGVLRSVKNVTKGYSAVQVKVRNATSNAPWGMVPCLELHHELQHELHE
jgi:hypothetical protein